MFVKYINKKVLLFAYACDNCINLTIYTLLVNGFPNSSIKYSRIDTHAVKINNSDFES